MVSLQSPAEWSLDAGKISSGLLAEALASIGGENVVVACSCSLTFEKGAASEWEVRRNQLQKDQAEADLQIAKDRKALAAVSLESNRQPSYTPSTRRLGKTLGRIRQRQRLGGNRPGRFECRVEALNLKF